MCGLVVMGSGLRRLVLIGQRTCGLASRGHRTRGLIIKRQETVCGLVKLDGDAKALVGLVIMRQKSTSLTRQSEEGGGADWF